MLQDTFVGRWRRRLRYRRLRRRLARMDDETLLDEYRAIVWAHDDVRATREALSTAAGAYPRIVSRWVRVPSRDTRRRIKNVDWALGRVAEDLDQQEHSVASALLRREQPGEGHDFVGWSARRRQQVQAEREHFNSW